MLELSGLVAGYGETRVLHGLDLSVAAGGVHAVLGRNGAGKTTTLKAIMGLVPASAGRIELDGRPLAGESTHAIARRGVTLVPETRDIFPSLTVRENLEIAARAPAPDGGWTMARVLELFPRLGERLDNGGAALSGGEQQMLAIARGLLMNPRLLLLDEPTEGLAPIVVALIREKLAALRAEGMTMVLVEQNLGLALALADRVTVIGRGRAVWTGSPAALREDTALQSRWLGI